LTYISYPSTWCACTTHHTDCTIVQYTCSHRGEWIAQTGELFNNYYTRAVRRIACSSNPRRRRGSRSGGRVRPYNTNAHAAASSVPVQCNNSNNNNNNNTTNKPMYLMYLYNLYDSLPPNSSAVLIIVYNYNIDRCVWCVRGVFV